MTGGLWQALGANPSATFVLAAVVLLFVLGVFVPRWVVKATLKAKDEEIGRWREAWTTSETARSEERRQTDQILSGLKELSDGMALVTAIVRAIRTSVNSSPHVEEERDDT